MTETLEKTKDGIIDESSDNTEEKEFVNSELQIDEEESATANTIIKKIIDLADKGFQLTYDENKEKGLNFDSNQIEEVNLLFAEILSLSDVELRPILQSNEESCGLTDEQKNILQMLHNTIINCTELAIAMSEGKEELEDIESYFGEISLAANSSHALKLTKYGININ